MKPCKENKVYYSRLLNLLLKVIILALSFVFDLPLPKVTGGNNKSVV